MSPRQEGVDVFAYEKGRGPLSRVVEAVHYDLAPALNKVGAHVWIEDIGDRGAVLGFTSWGDLRGPELKSWLQRRLLEHLDDGACAAIVYRDRTPVLPSAGTVSSEAERRVAAGAVPA